MFPEMTWMWFRSVVVELGGYDGGSSELVWPPFWLATTKPFLRIGRPAVPAIGPEGWTGKPVRVASDAHVAAGESAFITVSCATGSLEFFDQSSNTFAPGRRPATTPLIAPAPSACKAPVTSAPFSLSVVREMSALDGAATWIATDVPVTIPVSTVSGLAIE